MKRHQFMVVVAALIISTSALAADVGVSISVGEPGFYGRLDIGNFPQPQLVYPAPVVIERAPARVAPQPVYLRVPPGHAKHWRKHCAEYNACDVPVYFVQERWYNEVYAPSYRSHHGHDEHGDHDADDHGRGGGGHGRGKGHRDHE